MGNIVTCYVFNQHFILILLDKLVCSVCRHCFHLVFSLYNVEHIDQLTDNWICLSCLDDAMPFNNITDINDFIENNSVDEHNLIFNRYPG